MNNDYYIGIYSKGRPFSKNVAQIALTTVQKYYPGFFPVKFEYANKQFHAINDPSDFSYDMIPHLFWINENVSVRIPFDGANGIEMTIVDDRKSESMPSNLLINWRTKEEIPETEIVEKLFIELINALNPTYAIVTDSNSPIEEVLYDRLYLINSEQIPNQISWMTWLGPSQLKYIKPNSLLKVKNLAKVTSCNNGFVIRITDEPYEHSNEDHRKVRKEIEDALGYTEYYETLIP